MRAAMAAERAKAAAERQRRRRAREREGLAVIAVEVFVVDLAATLVAAGRLPPHLEDDRLALTRAVEAVLADLAAEDL
jgi:hypothetical protein